MVQYAELLIAAFATYERWKQRSRNRDGYFVNVKLDSEELPEKVYVVLGMYPEMITWPGEWAPYRLKIDLVWWNNCHPAFASREEAQQCADECFAFNADIQCVRAIEADRRFTVVELAVVK